MRQSYQIHSPTFKKCSLYISAGNRSKKQFPAWKSATRSMLLDRMERRQNMKVVALHRIVYNLYTSTQANQSIDWSIDESIDQEVNQTIRQSISRPDARSNNQLNKQETNTSPIQSINQYEIQRD